ncbi:MAG TPA: contractile injection system tape measure protein, partial [Chitinophaga sp.]|nr:contractile injection system tape measure protein [Chitinophaga sp.]
MSSREHIIRRITFDIGHNREQDAKALQDRYSRLFNNSLAGITEKVIEQVMDPAESIWLKRVEIDLGEVSYHSFEEEIIRLWPEALEKMLASILTKEGARRDSTNISLHFRDETERRYALLEHYLYTGSLPWWAAPSEGVMLEDMLLMLIHASTQRFTRFMMGLSQQEYVLKRIIYHFSRNAVQQVITALEEEQSTFIFRYITSVIAIHSRQQVVKAGQNEFEKAVWLFVLTYLVTDNSGQFNRKQFIRRNLERLARHFNIDYVHLLYIFRRAIDHYRQAIPPESFATFIQVLYEENDKAQIYTDQPHATVVMGNDNAEQVMAPRLLKVPGANGLTLPLPLLWIHYDNILAQADKEEVWQQAV